MRDEGVEGGRPGAGERNLPAPMEPRNVPAMRESYGYGVAGYPDYAEESELAATLRYFIGIAWKWRTLILGTAGAFLAIGLAYSFLATPLYSANVRIQIDREPGKIVDNGTMAPAELGGAEFQKTQYELLKSRGMSERVVASLALDQNASFTGGSTGLLRGMIDLFSASSEPTDEAEQQDKARSQAVRRIQNGVDIKPVPASRLVDIVYTDPSPLRAASIANAYADAYVASNLDKRFEASAYAKVFLEDQIKQLKLRLEESERGMIAFAERENMVQTNDKVSIAESNLAAANAALGQLISNRIRDEETWKQVENATAINLPQLLTNSVIDGLRTQRNELKRDYEEKLETFKPGYPAMMEISKKIAETDRQLATEVATIRNSLKAAYESSVNQEAQMRQRIDELRADVLDLQKKSVQYGILQREAETNRNLYNDLLQRYKEVDVASGVGTNNVFIVDRALPPNSPSHPRILLIAAGSLFLGLLAGFGSANLIELLDDRIRTPEDAEKSTGLPILGIIPKASFPNGLLPELANPRSGVAEAYRSLATSLQFTTDTGLPRTIVVTSAQATEGKSSTAIAVARHFAVTGKRVLIIDADLRRPSLHTKLGHDNAVGLTNCLTGMATLHDVVQPTDIPNLWFLASGPLPPNAADILGGTHVFSLISVGLEMYDLIIFDSPPMLGLADAQLLGAAASATIFVVGAGDARRGMLRGALRRLQMARAMTIGLVLTKFDSRQSSYGYGHAYGYGYGYEQDGAEGGQTKRSLLPSFTRREAKSNESEMV
ncbi:capsular exopolysaccharide family [Ancylobacter novellus DSM 506]|uniref:non-specific protein-tyrosine kinase n=1 Tax=Ancylobacter novellus (strain ATCC 8093 / DSM 506 / JCM 20403 / CCM 1077 / IAM 12100 / NBRC 12443 / NCIMB 10456) TaxID=639283 RepID=D7A842_ANCN5|nr:polysaccharide biosynthesis tyrosine autokinase [Ancylobacter novellus]ADH90500.1 capsular exopolysaccharide family [Ancylobacter novellus DSM 506]